MRYRRDLCEEYLEDPTPFGRLTPIRWVGVKHNTTIWLFRCTCGKTVEAYINHVKPGMTQSCGCLRRESSTGRILPHAGWNRLPVALAGLNMVYRKYQHRAETKNLAFDLTLDQFAYLIHQPCYIPNCGVVNSNAIRVNGRDEIFRYNGIDRIDSNGGYIDGNVAPCCKTCNSAKSDMTLNDFFSWLERLRGVR